MHRSGRSPPRYQRSPTPQNRRTPSKSPSPSLLAKVVPKKSININDTSLFAELVKGKHKQEKMLKEILKESSKIINVDAPDGSEPKAPNGDLTDIPIPPTNGISAVKALDTLTNSATAPPPPPPESNNLFVIKKNRPTELPMPPGVDVPLELKTPSPPKEFAGPSKKIRLLDMPMPPMIMGKEELSNDENDATSFGRKGSKLCAKGNGTAKTQRPKIISRRRSDNSAGDWGERCVEVFQIMAQIGEGKFLKLLFHKV